MIDGRRTSVVHTGSAFSVEHLWLWGYNTRSELTTAERDEGTDPQDPADIMDPGYWTYAYDPIGNRLSHSVGPYGTVNRSYCANELNQYTHTHDGTNTCSDPTNPTEAFEHDADGNLVEDGTFAYIWDGENRLIGVAPAASPVNGDKKLEFQYDYMSRRVEKKVYTYSSGWGSPTEVLRFVYDRWNVILVLDGLDDNAALKKYTWGLDLSGQRGDPSVEGIHGAGGIGGLLAVEETTGTHAGSYWFLYDANGNVGQVVKNTTNYPLAAHYEYDAYGNVLGTPAGYAAANPFRFSTKQLDTENGHYYYGYRYYNPGLGRWINRDPIEEDGGSNLASFVENSPMVSFDPLGDCGTTTVNGTLGPLRITFRSLAFGGCSLIGRSDVTKKVNAAFSGSFPITTTSGCPVGKTCKILFTYTLTVSYPWNFTMTVSATGKPAPPATPKCAITVSTVVTITTTGSVGCCR